jgi:hypothetical protein
VIRRATGTTGQNPRIFTHRGNGPMGISRTELFSCLLLCNTKLVNRFSDLYQRRLAAKPNVLSR